MLLLSSIEIQMKTIKQYINMTLFKCCAKWFQLLSLCMKP